MPNDHYWNNEAEQDFIDGLGEHTEKHRIKMAQGRGFTQEEWLKKYIAAHRVSPYAHHKVGVEYAKLKLVQMQ